MNSLKLVIPKIMWRPKKISSMLGVRENIILIKTSLPPSLHVPANSMRSNIQPNKRSNCPFLDLPVAQFKWIFKLAWHSINEWCADSRWNVSAQWVEEWLFFVAFLWDYCSNIRSVRWMQGSTWHREDSVLSKGDHTTISMTINRGVSGKWFSSWNKRHSFYQSYNSKVLDI